MAKQVGRKGKGETSASPGQHNKGNFTEGSKRDRVCTVMRGTMVAKKELKEGQGGGNEMAKGVVRWADVKDCVGWAGGWNESSEWSGNMGRQEPGVLAGMPWERRGGVRQGMKM